MMDFLELQNTFIEILRSSLTECELDESVKAQLTPETVSALYALSKQHDLAHIMTICLNKNKIPLNEQQAAKFNRAEMISIYRYEQMNYAYAQICDTLDKAEIRYIPLKGAVIRPYYPNEYMRTSCDIDILVNKEQLTAAVDALVEAGFTCGEKNYHDVSLFSSNGIHLELHFNIQENIENLDKVLCRAWSYATLVGGGKYEFSKEFFTFHIYAHISYHFLTGGCGIRSLMDMWVMEHKMGCTYLDAKELLEEAGIYTFAAEIHRLAEVCFSDEPRDEFANDLLSYIFSGGVYGCLENNMAINHSKTHVTLRYICKRIFVPYKDIAIEYPSAKKVPVLYIFCWFHRTGKLALRLLKRIFLRKKLSKVVSDEKTDKLMQMRSRLKI